GKGSTKTKPPRGKDLLERLMEKGLMPLSALDVIRGWMILEMSTSTEEERRIVKAATRNRLGYQEVKQALLAMYEDRGKGGGRPFAAGKSAMWGEMETEADAVYAGAGMPAHMYYTDEHSSQGWWPNEYDWGYYGEEQPWEEEEPEWTADTPDEPNDEVYAQLREEQQDIEQQRRDLEAMMAENDRNLAEARKAVANAARDRGWHGNVQQRQQRPTSTYMTKGKGKNGKGKAGKSAKMAEEAHWMGAKKGFKGPPFKSKGKGQGKGSLPWGQSFFTEGPTLIEDAEFFTTTSADDNPNGPKDNDGNQLKATEGLVDTGATATAGGQTAVERLCAAVAAARPELKVTIHESVRPYFRYGSGKWGRALYKVSLSWKNNVVNLFALPSEGVPVLVGMRELKIFVDNSDYKKAPLRWITIGNEPKIPGLPSDSASMAASSSEMKEAIRTVVREEVEKTVRETIRDALAEENGSRGATKGGRKKKGEATVYDETRKMGGDERDPRRGPDQWPCYGRHIASRGANRYGRWEECGKCGYRMGYTPAVNAPAESTRTNLPMNVTEALERLRQSGIPADEVEIKQIKNMIDIVAKEKRLLATRKTQTAKAKARADGKARSPREDMDGYIKVDEAEDQPVNENYKAETTEPAKQESSPGDSGDDEAGPADDSQDEVKKEEDEELEWLENSSELKANLRNQIKKACDEFNVSTILAALQPLDVWEVACRTGNTFGSAGGLRGATVHCKTLDHGYDINKEVDAERLRRECLSNPPWRLWLSPACILPKEENDRNTMNYEANLRKKRTKVRKQLEHMDSLVEAATRRNYKGQRIYVEIPYEAKGTWNLEVVKQIRRRLEQGDRQVYQTHINACELGVRDADGKPVKKAWVVMHNDHEFHDVMNTRCRGDHEHGDREAYQRLTEAGMSFYPPQMVLRIQRLWQSQTARRVRDNDAQAVMMAAVELEEEIANQRDLAEEQELLAADEGEVRENELVTEDMKEQARALLHRLHKAAGHPSNRALARICRDRGMPKWVVDLAINLKCQACLNTQRGEQLIVPHSVGTKPQPWQMIGIDVFELVFPEQRRKARYLITMCLVMRYMTVELLWEGPMNETGTDSGEKLVSVFSESWLQHRPRPEWLLCDPQSSLSKGVFSEFCHWIGVGLAVTPGEGHWQNGAVETAVKSVKKTMKRLRNDDKDLSPKTCGHLAAMAHNNMDKVK
ncbi:CACNA1B, partial [Symbiodinium necroappetens]